MDDIAAVLTALVGCIVPLIGSAMIPNGSQRWGAAIFAAIGLFVFINFMSSHESPSAFAVGLGIGFMLSTIKLATGLRFI